MLEGSPLHLAVRLANGDAAVAFTVGYDTAVMNDDDAANAPLRDAAMLYTRHAGQWTGRTISAPGMVVAGFQNAHKDTVYWSAVTVGGAGPEFAGVMVAGTNASNLTCSNLDAPPLPSGRSFQDVLFEVKEFGLTGRNAQVIGEYTDNGGSAPLPTHRYLFRSMDGGRTWGTPRRVASGVHVANPYQRIQATDESLEHELGATLVLLPQPE